MGEYLRPEALVAPRGTVPSGIGRAALSVDRVAQHIENAAMVLSALSVGVITVLVVLEVFLRSAFEVSTLISSEMSGYLLTSNVFLGLAWTFRNGGFIRVDILYLTFKGRFASVVNLFLAVVATAILVIYAWHLYTFVLHSYSTQATSIYTSRTLLWMPQLVMPVGAVLLAWATFAAAVRALIELIRPGSVVADSSAKPTEMESWL
ncbi:MAG: TRAP transporter small permease subunit [Rhodobacteraceae bacterium]|nr:TRAP transporter small permease subunit [Paracoccaceae bacterium]